VIRCCGQLPIRSRKSEEKTLKSSERRKELHRLASAPAGNCTNLQCIPHRCATAYLARLIMSPKKELDVDMIHETRSILVKCRERLSGHIFSVPGRANFRHGACECCPCRCLLGHVTRAKHPRRVADMDRLIFFRKREIYRSTSVRMLRSGDLSGQDLFDNTHTP